VRQRLWMVVGATFALMMVACGTPGKSLPMGASTQLIPAPAKLVSEPVRVAVVTFEDVRADKTAIGRWQHYVESQVDRMVPLEGTAAEQISGFVANYLRLAGFQVTKVPSREQVSSGSADVVLTGRVETYWNEAVAKLGRTELISKNRLVITLVNLADNSTVSSTLTGEQTSTVVTFDLGDLEKLNSNALAQSMARFLGDLRVSERSLKTN